MKPVTFNKTYTKYNLGPFMKVKYGKDVAEIVPSMELPNDKIVIKLDHFQKDDFVNVTRIVHATNVTPCGEKVSEENYPQKKFSSDLALDERAPRNKREALEQAHRTEIIRQKRNPR